MIDLRPLIRRLNTVIDELEQAEEGSEALDASAGLLLTAFGADLGALSYTRSLDHALQTIPSRWWWYTSHLEASVTPTTRLAKPFAELVSNSVMYEQDGRPVRFTSYAHYNRKRLPLALFCAGLKARRALLLPETVPESLRTAALGLLRERNPEATFHGLAMEHQFQWLARAFVDWQEPS